MGPGHVYVQRNGEGVLGLIKAFVYDPPLAHPGQAAHRTPSGAWVLWSDAPIDRPVVIFQPYEELTLVRVPD